MKSIVFLIPLAIFSLGQCEGPSHAWADGAADALMKYYDHKTGLWTTTGWWNGGNCLTSIIDYMILTGSRKYISIIDNTYNVARHHPGTKDFTNEFVDDTGWWGLAWVRAYDLTKDHKYLQMAQYDADYMYRFRDNVCKGGLYWKTDKHGKNAIENELFIKLAASLHNRIKGDTKYLNQAREIWNWFKGTGMINKDHLINDGVDLKTCRNNNGQTFTYNQGVILGGLAQLYEATRDQAYMNEARTIGDAATKSAFLNPNGILREPGEGDGCGGDGPSFKGIFVRNLAELSRSSKDHRYQAYLKKVATSAYNHDRNNNNQYGNHWAGPIKETGAACQHIALDLMNADFNS